MAYQAIDLGTSADDGTGDSLRAGGDKVNDNFSEVYTLLGTGSTLSSGISADGTVITLSSAVGTFTTLTPAASDGTALGSASLEFSDLYLADGAVINFGADQDVTLTHVADSGLTLKSIATADDKPVTITLATGETDMAANDVIGAINFQAPDEGTGTDAILVAAAIKAYAEGDFSSSSNATTLGFYTGSSEAAAIKMTLSSGGNLDVTGTIQGTTITAETAFVPDASDGAALGTTALEFSDLYLADGAVINFGADQDVTLTHVADTGLLLNSTMKIQFNDASQFIHGSSATVLSIGATDEIDLTATAIDINGTVDISGTALITGVTTHGGNVISDTDSTDDLGTTGVRWRALYVDAITATDQITATGFTGTLDGILGSGAAAAATTTTLASTTITASGIIKTDDTTAATSTTDGSLQTDGGLSVALDAVIGDDLIMLSDAAVVHFGADKDVTLTHVADTGLLLNSTMQLQFNDASQFINAPSATVLDINATDEIELNATAIDLNGTLTVSGDTTLETGADLITASAGTSNFRAGVNAGNSIESGGNYNVAIGDEAGTAITTGDNNVAVGYQALDANTTGAENTAIGDNALGANISGSANTAVGKGALLANTAGSNTAFGHTALTANIGGASNTAVGQACLDANTTGSSNTSVGTAALGANTTASNNTAVGASAMTVNTTGHSNVAVGTAAFDANTTGNLNVALGNAALGANTTADYNTAVGSGALLLNTTGASNTAVGYLALDANTTAAYNSAFGQNALGANTTGASNTAVGYAALAANTTGTYNTAVGRDAGAAIAGDGNYNTLIGALAGDAITTGDDNTAVGRGSLSTCTTSSQNTAIGSVALEVLTTATNNTAVGYGAGKAITTGASNTAVGAAALDANTTGAYNDGFGWAALGACTTGTSNSAFGNLALDALTTGASNTGFGQHAGGAITTAANNTCLGTNSGMAITTGASNTAVGYAALDANTTGAGGVVLGYGAGSAVTTGGYNVMVGYNAGTQGAYITTGAGNVYIGNGAGASANAVSNEMTVSATANSVGKGTGTGFITAGSGGMYQGNNGTAWTQTSDRRIKKDIVPNIKGLAAIIQIEPKNFYYKSDEELQEELPGAKEKLPLNKLKTSAIAQELDQIFPEAIERRGEHDIMSVNTDPIFWSMVNAIKELSAKNEALEDRIKSLEG